jgi:ABC-type transport system involved in multi-copper enzyme maturation permease subunit
MAASATSDENRVSPDSPASPAVSEAAAPQPPSLLMACGHLWLLTLRRLFFSRQTFVALGLTVLCGLIVMAWGRQASPEAKKFADQVLLPLFVGFLLPIYAISYGAAAIGGEREDRTLIYLLIAPLPRPAVYLVKAFAVMLLAVGWTIAALLVLCLLAGHHGRETLPAFWQASVMGALVYANLFLVLGAAFRHGTIISLAYWFFLEVLFGAMPGIVKRLTVSFYVKCQIFDAGKELELGPVRRIAREMFLPVSGDVAFTVMSATLATLVVLGVIVFSTREYAELG